MNYKMRDCCEKDYNALLSIFDEVQLFHYENRPDLYKPTSTFSKEFFNEILNDKNKILCVFEEDVVKGFVFAYIKETKNIPSKKDRRILFIDGIGVKKEYQKCGIGSILMNNMLEYATKNKVDAIELNVYNFNQNAIDFYKSFGFNVKSLSLEKSLNYDYEKFWREFAEKNNIEGTFDDVFSFGFEKDEADNLLALVLDGKKQATSSLLKSYKLNNEELPKVNSYSIVTNSENTPKAIIKTTKISLIPFNQVTFDICKKEGEDENLESWQKKHIDFFKKEGEIEGYTFYESDEIVFEEFICVFKK